MNLTQLAASFLWFGLVGGIIAILIVGAVLIFEIIMFFDVLTSKGLTTEAKILWALGMVLIHPFVAIIYFFTDHKKHDQPLV